MSKQNESEKSGVLLKPGEQECTPDDRQPKLEDKVTPDDRQSKLEDKITKSPSDTATNRPKVFCLIPKDGGKKVCIPISKYNLDLKKHQGHQHCSIPPSINNLSTENLHLTMQCADSFENVVEVRTSRNEQGVPQPSCPLRKSEPEAKLVSEPQRPRQKWKSHGERLVWLVETHQCHKTACDLAASCTATVEQNSSHWLPTWRVRRGQGFGVNTVKQIQYACLAAGCDVACEECQICVHVLSCTCKEWKETNVPCWHMHFVGIKYAGSWLSDRKPKTKDLGYFLMSTEEIRLRQSVMAGMNDILAAVPFMSKETCQLVQVHLDQIKCMLRKQSLSNPHATEVKPSNTVPEQTPQSQEAVNMPANTTADETVDEQAAGSTPAKAETKENEEKGNERKASKPTTDPEEKQQVAAPAENPVAQQKTPSTISKTNPFLGRSHTVILPRKLPSSSQSGHPTPTVAGKPLKKRVLLVTPQKSKVAKVS